MAAPTFVAATTAGTTDTGGAWTHTTNAPGAAGRLIICHVFQDGTSANNAISIDSATNCTALDGTSNAFTALSATGSPVGSVSTPTGYHYLFFARSTGTSAVVITGSNSGTNDIYVRAYEFSGVHTGADLLHVIENSTAGAFASDAGNSASVTDVGVTTIGTDRLCLNFIAVADEAQVGELTAMTGETGGDWTYPVAAWGTATGTDGTLALVSATLASAGTINGGSDAITSEAWGVIGFALRPTTATLVQYGASVLPLTLDYVSQGTAVPAPATLYGSSVLPLTLGFVSQGIPTRMGSSVVPLTLELTTQGTRALRAQGAVSFAASLTTQGARETLGQSALAFTFDTVSNGTIEAGGGTDYFGSAVLDLTANLTTSGHQSQIALVTADSVDGAWTDQDGGSDLEGALDEPSYSDLDYIRSELNPDNSACRIKLEGLTDPADDTGHVLRWRIAKDAADGSTVNLTLTLREGGGDVLGAGTEIATFTRSNVSESFTTFEEQLTALQAGAITDYSALYVELVGDVA